MIYFLVINIITFITYGLDKYKSIKHKYRISQTTNLDQVQIFDGRNWRKPEEVLEIAKNKGISFKDSGEVVKNLTEIFEGGAKNIKNKLKELGYKLDAILYDESVNKC